MIWPFHNRSLANYWIKVFGLYALFEGCIQLLFNYLLNNFGNRQISNLEFHSIMWLFQCLMIWPIWWVAYAVHREKISIQIIVNLLFFILYSYVWFGPVQDIISYLHQEWQQVTRPVEDRIVGHVDKAAELLPYQLVKHTFRLSWFFLANYLYYYRREEAKRLELAVANKELQLKLLKWHLNPAFYFKTIDHLRQQAAVSPTGCTRPILQLAKVMEYVIYEAKEKMIDVSKEVSFLNDYLQLISQQPDHAIKFKLLVEGDPGKLKIAPLLLAGFIDKIVARHSRPGEYTMKLEFSEQNMSFRIHGDLGESGQDFFGSNEDALYRRLTEFYRQKFSWRLSSGNNFFELNLRLNEEA
jgi:hypothetical protein